jgi:hypothetical protein
MASYENRFAFGIVWIFKHLSFIPADAHFAGHNLPALRILDTSLLQRCSLQLHDKHQQQLSFPSIDVHETPNLFRHALHTKLFINGQQKYITVQGNHNSLDNFKDRTNKQNTYTVF